jgi:hypothetical protein
MTTQIDGLQLFNTILNGFWLILFLTTALAPKIGEAILTRIFSGSLEKLKTKLAMDIETKKGQINIEIENHKFSKQAELEKIKATTTEEIKLNTKNKETIRDELKSFFIDLDKFIGTNFIKFDDCYLAASEILTKLTKLSHHKLQIEEKFIFCINEDLEDPQASENDFFEYQETLKRQFSKARTLLLSIGGINE